MYLYRAVNSEGNTIDFYLSESRDKRAAKRFFRKALAFSHVSMSMPRVITVDKNLAYPIAIRESKEEKHMPEDIQLRKVQYFNNFIEQHRFIKKRIRPILSLKSLRTAKQIIVGIEAMHMT